MAVNQSEIQNPVWDVYDLYRTARLNVKYLGRKIRRLKFWHNLMEFALMITASSSFASMTIWESSIGIIVWQILTAITAIIAILKKLLRIDEVISKKEKILDGYKILDHDLQKIVMLIRDKKRYDGELKEMFWNAYRRKVILVKNDKELRPNLKLLKECENEVKQELPVHNFFIPEVI